MDFVHFALWMARVRGEIKHPWAKWRNGEMQLAKLGEIGYTWTLNFLKAAKCLS